MSVDPRELLKGTEEFLRPPPLLSLSQWADEHFYLSPESSAEPGRWRTLPYQRGVMDTITDPTVEQITLMKSARVGFTKIVDAAIGYYMHQDPCPILVVQPTVEDAQGYSKEEIAPMLRDCEALSRLVKEPTAKISEQTILMKTFPGGSLSMVGANSGRGFRRVSRRVVIFDEVDGYPPSAGTEGDQIKLGIRRSEYYWNRKIIAGSTPLIAGASRIEEMFDQGDRRRYHLPCPHCGHMDILVFREGSRGHYMKWPEGRPQDAYFVCFKNGCVIEHKDKRSMLDSGEWIAECEFKGHASFHIWAGYSMSPNATWGQIAIEFADANEKGAEKLKTFINTFLGETWHDRGEAPEWERLYQRREKYPIGTVPEGVRFLTAGVDVQKDRFVYEVVGWAETKESWSIDAGVLMGDTSDEKTWALLDGLLNRTYRGTKEFSITMMGIDSGYNTQEVYNWARRHPMNRVVACKGVGTARTLIGIPSPVDVTVQGKKLRRGYKVWGVGVSIAKSELYGWLRLPMPQDDEPFPVGFCHFPEYDQEFFKQITAEHLVPVKKKTTGFVVMEWQMIPGRQNHFLDGRVYARAAASICGLDRLVVNPSGPPKPKSDEQKQTTSTPGERVTQAVPTKDKKRNKGGGWLSGGGRGSGWLGKRR